MFEKALYLLAFYFLIGGIGLVFIVRKNKGANSKLAITKYVSYIVVVFGMLFLIYKGYAWETLWGICLIGLYELINAGFSKKLESGDFAVSILVYAIICFGALSTVSWIELVIVFLIYTIIAIFDGYCQIAGQLFGKKKLLPRISPAKTMEGFILGFIISFFTILWLDISTPWLYSTGLLLSAFLGDLLESKYKRMIGIKDFPTIIPGHGGVLDRFDSFLSALAFVSLWDYFQ